jgi:glycosyltransferase involved in cell wall biosynthesis
MKKCVFVSNMWNEMEQLPGWLANVKLFADGGIVIVDSGSTDGSIDYASRNGAIVVVDDIIQREGYAAARAQLRVLAELHFPDAHWTMLLDADERIEPRFKHTFRWIKDYLTDDYDIVAFPRIDWRDTDRIYAANDVMMHPDWQSRMVRYSSNVMYFRRLHEQITGFKNIFADLYTPPIDHFHRSAVAKRDVVGKLCAKLHMEDIEFGHTYPEHPKEAEYRERYKKEGL